MTVVNGRVFTYLDRVTVFIAVGDDWHQFTGYFISMDETGVIIRSKPDRNVGFTFFPMDRVVKIDAEA